MKEGKTLEELAREISRRQEAKRDYIVPASAIHVATGSDGAQVMELGNVDSGTLTDYSRGQLASHLAIPQKYVDTLRTEGMTELLDRNFNERLAVRSEDRLVRLLDGNARAYLSNRYRRLDHADLLERILPVMFERSDLMFRSCEVTDSRLHLKIVTDSVTGEVQRGDMVRGGFILQNSEVGAGAVSVSPFVERLVCSNGMVLADSGMKRFHLGSRFESDGNVSELLTDETKRSIDETLFLQVRDVLSACLENSTFELILSKFREAANSERVADPVKAVERIQRVLDFTQAEGAGILRHLCEGGDFTRWGMGNAVTRFAADVDSYDRATELEAIGAKVIDLNPSEWRVLAAA